MRLHKVQREAMKTTLARCYVVDSKTGIERLFGEVVRDGNGRYSYRRSDGGLDRCRSLSDGIAVADSIASVCPSYRQLSRVEKAR